MAAAKQTIGFIGLGIMGRPMTQNLNKAGYPLVVHDLNKDSVKEIVGIGAKEGTGSANVAGSADIVITMLPDSPDVEAAYLGPGGVLEGVSGFMGGDAQRRDGGSVVDFFRKPEDLFAGIVMVRQMTRDLFDRDVSGAPRLQDPVRRLGARQSRRRANPAEPRVGASDFRLGEEGQGKGRNDQQHRRIPEHFIFLLLYDIRIPGRIKRPGPGRGKQAGRTSAGRGNRL